MDNDKKKKASRNYPPSDPKKYKVDTLKNEDKKFFWDSLERGRIGTVFLKYPDKIIIEIKNSKTGINMVISDIEMKVITLKFGPLPFHRATKIFN